MFATNPEILPSRPQVRPQCGNKLLTAVTGACADSTAPLCGVHLAGRSLHHLAVVAASTIFAFRQNPDGCGEKTEEGETTDTQRDGKTPPGVVVTPGYNPA